MDNTKSKLVLVDRLANLLSRSLDIADFLRYADKLLECKDVVLGCDLLLQNQWEDFEKAVRDVYDQKIIGKEFFAKQEELAGMMKTLRSKI